MGFACVQVQLLYSFYVLVRSGVLIESVLNKERRNAPLAYVRVDGHNHYSFGIVDIDHDVSQYVSDRH